MTDTEQSGTATLDAAVEDAPTSSRPYGSWPSIISAESLVAGARGIYSLQADGDSLYWLEARPEEGGRVTIMRRRESGQMDELLPAAFNARTRVHEYGGGSLLVADGVIWFSNFADQRLYRMKPGSDPQAITPAEKYRYAGCALDRRRDRLICIREDHRAEGEPINALVTLAAHEPSSPSVLFEGTDFVSAPRLDDGGEKVAFTSWQHPNMPWDNTSLHSAGFDEEGNLVDLELHNPVSKESVVDPQWVSSGDLIVLSDRDNWWRPYAVDGREFRALPVDLKSSEIGGPDWSIDTRYQLHDSRLGTLYIARTGAVERLFRVSPQGERQELAIGATSFSSMVVLGEKIYLVAGFPDRPAELLAVSSAGEVTDRIRATRDSVLAAEWVPAFKEVSFPVGEDAVAHGVYLPPKNPQTTASAEELPPLIVAVHGGPTSVASVGYRPDFYFWTSRGFAVLDLNYRGSTGFGRSYRRALYGHWGIADVDDAVAGARWLAEQGLADPKRLLIRGGSAGGYTTLAAHAFHSTFAAGASHYGISDIEALARDTHKFESRYLDQLIGPYPEKKELYRERSPIHHLAGFSAPLILLQGLEDPIVPPNQSEAIYEALRSSGVATAYIAFEGESHGFRKAENQIAARQAELYFYSKVLGFETADTLPAIAIENLRSL
ncbi:MAG: prolyl oligopeptidase family serine peptidase [Pseudomonadota bacterium]